MVDFVSWSYVGCGAGILFGLGESGCDDRDVGCRFVGPVEKRGPANDSTLFSCPLKIPIATFSYELAHLGAQPGSFIDFVVIKWAVLVTVANDLDFPIDERACSGRDMVAVQVK